MLKVNNSVQTFRDRRVLGLVYFTLSLLEITY